MNAQEVQEKDIAIRSAAALLRLLRDRRMLISICAGLLGLAMSYAEVQILPGVVMVFSGIFYLLISISLGPVFGGVSAAIAMSRTVWLLGNGYSVAFGVLESVCIGYLTRRRIAAPMAAVLFWLFVGLPVVSLTIFYVLHLPNGGWANVLKRCLNGFINVVVADLLLALPSIAGFLLRDAQRPRLLPLRDLISSSLLIVSMLPIVFISVGHVRSNTRIEETEAKTQMQSVVNALVLQLDDYVSSHKDAVEALATATSRVGMKDSGSLLKETHTIHDGFETMLMAGTDGVITQTSPPLPGAQNISDRAYFQEALRTGKPYLSRVFVGRGFGHNPIIAISAPILARNGVPEGIVEGSLDLKQFERFEKTFTELQQTDVLITDQADRVIYASPRMPYRVLEQIKPDQNADLDRSLLDRSSAVRDPGFLRKSMRSKVTGWTVTAQQSLLPLQGKIEEYYGRTVIWLLAAAALSYLLAYSIARKITSPLEALVRSLQNFHVGDPWTEPALASNSTPQELIGIQKYFGELAGRLTESYRSMGAALKEKEDLNQELTNLAAELDQKVQERTAELSQATSRAQAANSAKSLFLASMSHEIRTPLNAVIGMTDLLATSNLPTEELSLADTIRSSAHGLLVIINDILDFTKIESGKLELECVDFDIRDVVEGVAGIVAAQAQSKGIEFAFRISANVPWRLMGDPNRLQQIIMNLASNAVKFTFQGEVLIEVLLDGLKMGVAQLRVVVSDTGIGIAPEIQERLFQPFAQADVSTTRQFGGTGLGLAVSRRLAELMGGAIFVQSVPAAGATFWFEVPFEVSTEDAEFAPDVFNGRVLIVDDNANARLATQENLFAVSVQADTAPDSMTALRMLRTEPYAAAILDFSLDMVDGVAIDRAIREVRELRSLPLILLRPYSERMRGSTDPNSILLKKPAAGRKLLEALRSLTRRQEEDPDAVAVDTEAGEFKTVVKQRRKILLVEDNAINQRVALKMLAKLGFEADLAGDGLMAVRALQARHYDVILMDCQMPVMDGFEAAREIRKQAHGSMRAVIIALTANAFPEDRERCRRAGMDDYLAKPVSLETLRATLHKWLKPHRAVDLV